MTDDEAAEATFEADCIDSDSVAVAETEAVLAADSDAVEAALLDEDFFHLFALGVAAD